MAYTFGFVKNKNFNYQSEFLKNLKKWGFKTNEDNTLLPNIDELIKYHKNFEAKRFSLDYDVDGLVYKINDLKLQKRLGFTSNAGGL